MFKYEASYIKKKKSASPLMDLSANLLRDDEDNDNTRTNREKGEMTTGRLKLFMDAVYGIFATMAGVQLAFLDQGEVCEVYINQLEQSEKMQIHQYEFPNGISCPKLKNRSSYQKGIINFSDHEELLSQSFPNDFNPHLEKLKDKIKIKSTK